MRLLADENVDPLVIRGLRLAKHEVIDVKARGWQGTSDERLAALTRKHRCVLVTHDRDFLHHSTIGVVLIQIRRPRPALVLERLVDILSQTRYRTALRRKATVAIGDRETQIFPNKPSKK